MPLCEAVGCFRGPTLAFSAQLKFTLEGGDAAASTYRCFAIRGCDSLTFNSIR
jgi:hypothetical protein